MFRRICKEGKERNLKCSRRVPQERRRTRK